MQALKIFLTMCLISAAFSQILPATGKLEFTVFPGQSCPGSPLQTIIFPVSSSNCMSLLDIYSINVISYAEATNNMTVDVYQSKDCSANKISSGIEIGLNGTKCNEGLELPIVGAVGYKIKLNTISSKGQITLTTYKANDCKTQQSTSQSKATDLCLAVSDTTSFTPLTWDSVSDRILGYSYDGSNTCTQENPQFVAQASLVCDGTCNGYLTSKAYYKCEYTNSYKLAFSIFSLLLVLISLF
jgi:hypothetical protein